MARRLTLAGLGVAALGVAACSSAGDPAGGGERLPNRGIVPWERVTVPVPVDPATIEAGSDVEPEIPDPLEDVLGPEAPPKERFREPWLAWEADGAGRALALYYERDESGGPRDIWRTTVSLEALAATLDRGEAVLLGEDAPAWTGGFVGAPSVADGADGSRWMAFEGGDGLGIGLARWDGAAWVPDDEPVAVAAGAPGGGAEPGEGVDAWVGGFRAPSLLALPAEMGSGWALYAAAADSEGSESIVRWSTPSEGPAAGLWTYDGVVLAPEPECTDALGEVEACWDSVGVSSPEARLATTGAGRAIVRLMYAGTSNKKRDLGFAASFDGVAFDRFPFNPVWNGSGDAYGATTAFQPWPDGSGTYVLMAVDERRANNQGLALFRNDADNPTETF